MFSSYFIISKNNTRWGKKCSTEKCGVGGRHTCFSIQTVLAFIYCYGSFVIGERCGVILTSRFYLCAFMA